VRDQARLRDSSRRPATVRALRRFACPQPALPRCTPWQRAWPAGLPSCRAAPVRERRSDRSALRAQALAAGARTSSVSLPARALPRSDSADASLRSAATAAAAEGAMLGGAAVLGAWAAAGCGEGGDGDSPASALRLPRLPLPGAPLSPASGVILSAGKGVGGRWLHALWRLPCSCAPRLMPRRRMPHGASTRQAFSWL